MTKTIKLSDKTHSEIIKIQGELQLGSGEKYTLEDTLRELVKKWNDSR